MPVTITPHLDFETLVESLLQELEVLPKGVTPHPVVIPSIPFSDHLQLAIARKRGICMGLEFLTPSGFINRVTRKEKDSPWSSEQLAWRILPHAREYAERLGIDPANSNSRDLFAVSQLLADRLDQYGHFRPEMIRKWNLGESFFSQENPNEDWQRKLWSTLRDEIGNNQPHPSISIERLQENDAFLKDIPDQFPAITVIGTGTIDPQMIEVLRLLDHCKSSITLHVLLPTMEFLDDLHRKELLPDSSLDPEKFPLEAQHPLLCSMGRHAVGSFRLLGELQDDYKKWPDPDFQRRDKTLLHRLQDDIHLLKMGTADPTDPADTSVRIHSCFGHRREMETLRDELLRAFSDMNDLKPHEIHIVTPSLPTYAPLVSAVLEQITHHSVISDGISSCDHDIPLPVRVTELSRSDQDPVILGLVSLLEMSVAGRFEASWLMELLHLKAVQKQLGINDDEGGLERVRSWVRDSGLTQGFDDSKESPAIGSWAFARNRLIAGSWFGDLTEASYGEDKGFALPVSDQLGGDFELLECFIKWHDILERTLKRWQGKAVAASAEEPFTPQEWGVELSVAAKELLGCTDGEDMKIRPYLNFLNELQCPAKVNAGTILDWLTSETGDERRRTPNSGKITFGRFKQLQNIPCRVLAMVGMKDGEFPARSRIPAWDLLQASPRLWDRNPRIDDRQLFLDALLTPKDRLIITAPTLNVRTNREEPFSSCVDELIRVLTAMGAAPDQVIVKHKLQPFSPEYFKNDSILPRSFSKAAAKVAEEIARAGEPLSIPFWDKNNLAQPDPGKVDVEITLKELIDFWKDPAKAYVKAQGISTWRDEEDDEDLDRAPITLNSLESWKIKDAIVQEIAFGSGNLSLAKALLSGDRKLPAGELGERAWKKNLDKSKEVGATLKTLSKSQRLGTSCIVETSATPLLPSMKVRITGEILVSTDDQFLVAYRAGTIDKAKHHLAPFITAVISAYDRKVSKSLPTWLIDEENSSNPRLLPEIMSQEVDPFRAAAAQVFITNMLVTGYLEGQLRPLCYAPETSNALAEHLTRAENGDQGPPDTAAVIRHAAAEKWYGEEKDFQSGDTRPREGGEAGAKIAWRNLNPFDNTEEWKRWADELAAPLRKWGNF